MVHAWMPSGYLEQRRPPVANRTTSRGRDPKHRPPFCGFSKGLTQQQKKKKRPKTWSSSATGWLTINCAGVCRVNPPWCAMRRPPGPTTPTQACAGVLRLVTTDLPLRAPPHESRSPVGRSILVRKGIDSYTFVYISQSVRVTTGACH